MSLSLRPTLSALLRNRTGAILVALQVAIALAVLVNALYIVHQHIEKMNRPTRIDDANLFGFYSIGYTAHFDYPSALHADLTWLRGLPGVVDATPTNSVPMGVSGSATAYRSLPGDKGNQAEVNLFQMDEHGLNTLGVRLVAGRGFRADEILPATGAQPRQIIITEAVGRRLFPHENALGRTLYEDKDPITIIGIIDDMIGSGWWGYQSPVQVAILPQLPSALGSGYLVRTLPGRRDALMRQVEQHLSASNQDRVILGVRSIEDNRKRLYATDRATGGFLLFVTALMVAVTALGIFSLATFNVATRRRQIGIRRAVGARCRDIVRHFLVENGLITAAGVVAGSLLALAVGSWLSSTYAMPRLDLYYLLGGVLALWLTGQLAAWWPARRAAAVPPSVATRTV